MFPCCIQVVLDAVSRLALYHTYCCSYLSVRTTVLTGVAAAHTISWAGGDVETTSTILTKVLYEYCCRTRLYSYLESEVIVHHQQALIMLAQQHQQPQHIV